MAESGEAAASSSSRLGKMVRKALAPLLSTLIHAASVYLGRKAGELAQEKLVPRLQGSSQQAKQQPAKAPAAKKTAEDADSGRSAQRRDREKRRSQRRKALEQAGSS